MIIAVHDGSPHADDIFAAAILTLVYPEAEIIRTRSTRLLAKADIRVDVGMKYEPPADFDHHMSDFNLTREDGRPLASTGLVANYFWEELVGPNNREVFLRVDNTLFSFIDAVDSGVETYTQTQPYHIFDLNSILNHFYPHPSSLRNLKREIQREMCDYGFQKSVDFACDIILNEIGKAHLWLKDQQMVKHAIKMSENKDPRLIILRRSANWSKAVTELAKRLNYQPNAVALSLKNSKRFTIGVIIPETIHYFFSTVISGIEDIAYNAGYNVMICQSNEMYERELSNSQMLYSNKSLPLSNCLSIGTPEKA